MRWTGFTVLTSAALLSVVFQGTIFQGAQQLPISLSGVVVESATGKPLPRTSLELRSMDSGGNVVQLAQSTVPGQRYPGLSGDGGQFAFRNIPPGRYTLIASHTGYVHAEYGQRGPNGKGLPLTIVAGQPTTGVRLSMTQNGAISGHVFDSKGAPYAYVQMQAARVTYPEGQRTLTPTGATVTNDLGEYRIYGLPPGQYVLSAATDPPSVGIMPVLVSSTPPLPGAVMFQSASGPMLTTADPANLMRQMNAGAGGSTPIFFRNTTQERDAQIIEIRPGDDVKGINITTNPAARSAVTVNGSISGGDVSGAATITIAPGPSGNVRTRLAIQGAAALQRGSFTVSLPPGSYFAAASGRGNAGQSLAGYLAFEVVASTTPSISIDLKPTLSISGRVVVEGRPAGIDDPDLAKLTIKFRRSPLISWLPSSQSIAPKADGSFAVPGGLIDGDYALTVAGSSSLDNQRAAYAAADPSLAVPIIPEAFRNAYVKSVRASNADFVNNRLRLPAQLAGPIEIEIVLGVDGGQIAGAAVSAAGEAMGNVTVLLVPDQPDRKDLFKVLVTDTSGRYRFEGVAPGSYKLFSWEDVESDIWHTPDFIRARDDLGKPIRVAAGSRENTDVTVIPIR